MGSPLFRNISNPKKRAFLAAYAKVGTLTGAARDADVDISNHYLWKKADPDYVEAFDVARDMVADLHEDEATRRALGWEEEGHLADGTPYKIRKHSDTLMIVRLKALKPQEYRENLKVENEVTLTVKIQDQLHNGVKRLEDFRRGDSGTKRLA